MNLIFNYLIFLKNLVKKIIESIDINIINHLKNDKNDKNKENKIF